jgi:hypothetical protein
MNWNKWIRQLHRWLSATFTVTIVIVVVSMIASAPDDPADWVFYLPLPPLLLLLPTGLYLFVLPHATTWRSGRRTLIER